MPSLQLIQQMAQALDRCGRRRPPVEGVSVAPYPKSFLMQQTFPAGAGSPSQTITKEITGEYAWELRSIQAIAATTTAMEIQILQPNGKFLINNLQDLLQIAGYGSYRFAYTVGLVLQPGSKLQVTFLATSTAAQQAMSVLFEGAWLPMFKGDDSRICPVDELVGDVRRYFDGPNQNQFAPCWQVGATNPTPAGFEDEEYQYSALGPKTNTWPAGTPGSTISVTAANTSAIQQIQLTNEEFHCFRVLVQVSADNTVTAGSVLARIRSSSGYAHYDDYLNAALYTSGVWLPVEWVLAPNDAVFADLLLVDAAGTGNIYWTMFLDGFRRRRKVGV